MVVTDARILNYHSFRIPRYKKKKNLPLRHSARSAGLFSSISFLTQNSPTKWHFLVWKTLCYLWVTWVKKYYSFFKVILCDFYTQDLTNKNQSSLLYQVQNYLTVKARTFPQKGLHIDLWTVFWFCFYANLSPLGRIHPFTLFTFTVIPQIPQVWIKSTLSPAWTLHLSGPALTDRNPWDDSALSYLNLGLAAYTTRCCLIRPVSEFLVFFSS